MNANHVHRTLFWHVPKTAGRSMAELPFVTLKSHYPIAIAVREQNPREWEEYFKFAFVRHPMDRFVSLYHYFRDMTSCHPCWTRKRNRRLVEIAQYCDKRGGFATFCKAFRRSRILKRDMHFWPQHRWICDPYGSLLMDFVGRYESLTSDLEVVADKLKVPRGMARIRRTNVSDHRPWRDYYHNETRVNLIIEYYRADFRIFNYRADQ